MANTGDTLEQALARVREGDVEAFAHVVAAYHVSIRAYLAAAVADWAVADDLAQQTFVFAFEHVADYRPGSNCLAWLRTVARFKVLSHLRRQRQVRDKEQRYWQQEVLDQTVDAVGSEVIDQRLEAMTDCIARLPDAQREFVRQASARASTLEVLAASLNKSGTAVRKQLSRLHARLRACIESKTRST